LRTHSELGYKHEQRFHLELGLLKLVHAQRLLALEEILSGAATATPGRAPASAPTRPVASAPAAKPYGSAPSARPAAPAPATTASPKRPSPFESDLARRRDDPPRGNMSTVPSVEGTSAIAVATAPEPETAITQQPAELSLPKIQTATLTTMEKTNQKIVAHWLELGEWKIEGND